MTRYIKHLLAKRRLAKWVKDNRENMSSHQRASLKGWARRRAADRAGREPSRKRLGHTATIPSRGVPA